MNEEVKALLNSLAKLRKELMSTPRTDPGFGEMRVLYRELTFALIDAGDRADNEIAKAIESVSKNVADEWASNKDRFDLWRDVLVLVVNAVGALLKKYKLANPLTALLP